MAGTTNIVQLKKSRGLWTRSKGLRLWLLNLVLFTCFVLLSLTGLIPWIFLPRGHGGELGALRHTLIELHEWVALVLIALVILHLVWHWSYITASAKRWLRLPLGNKRVRLADLEAKSRSSHRIRNELIAREQ